MLVVLQNEQVLSTDNICQGCLLASQSGTPRWHQGKLGCGYCLGKSTNNQATVYECQMGFRLANIE
jgi:hypothetical protein